ncbi:MAG: DUF6261 family protein [Bacteroidales bacterium]|nr:DUF6261 family protein [Bacteroidales bacterium]
MTGLFAVFLTFCGQEDGTLEKIAKSGYISVIVRLDGVRDRTFLGLGESVKSASRHYDPLRRQAAETLEPLFAHYGNLAARPFNEETSAIHNFIQELRGKYAGAVAQLDLQGWTDELEHNNRDFETAVLERNRETAGQSDLKMLNCYHPDFVRHWSEYPFAVRLLPFLTGLWALSFAGMFVEMVWKMKSGWFLRHFIGGASLGFLSIALVLPASWLIYILLPAIMGFLVMMFPSGADYLMAFTVSPVPVR